MEIAIQPSDTRVFSLPRLCMGKNDQDSGKGKFFIKNAKEELKWEIWKVGSNLETFSKLEKLPKWWFTKWGFLSFQKWFYYKNPNIISKWFSWFKRTFLVNFSVDHGSMSLKEMDLKILEILENLDISWTSLSLGLTWTSVLDGRLGGKVNSWACRKRLKIWAEIYLVSRSKCIMEGLIHKLGMLGGMSCYYVTPRPKGQYVTITACPWMSPSFLKPNQKLVRHQDIIACLKKKSPTYQTWF